MIMISAVFLTHVNTRQTDLYLLSLPAAVNDFLLACHKIYTQKSGVINMSGQLILSKNILLSHFIL